MIIENLRLVECIESSILEYNNQFYKQEDENKKIDLNCIEYLEDGESANIPDDVLKKLENLSIKLPAKSIGKEELDAIIKQVSDILNKTNLKAFSFSMMNKGQQFSNLNMSFLKHLNEDLENLSISGIDLSQETSNLFEKFKNLRYLNLRKCNITNPQIISKTNPETFVKLEQNEIAPEYYFDAISLIKKSNGRINFSDQSLKKISEIYITKKVELDDYLHFRHDIDFESISGLTLNARVEDLPILKDVSDIRLPVTLIIKNVNELNLNELQQNKYISAIQISDGMNTGEQQKHPYSREEYTKVRKEIDKIISQVKLPEENDPDREKKIFSQVYKILGQKIDYDNYAISEEGNKDKRLQITCRNLFSQKQESKNIGYLSSCIISIANSGLTSTTIRKTANELNTGIKLKTVNHNEMEVTDGRT